MKKGVNFKTTLTLLKRWFDYPASHDFTFSEWRHQKYEELRTGTRNNLPLKTWWPKYTNGDFRLELSLGALLIQQTSWSQVAICIHNLMAFLKGSGKDFSVDGLLSIPPDLFKKLIQASRFPNQKTERIVKFCRHIQEVGGVDIVFKNRADLGQQLRDLKLGFGKETRDCLLLYGANLPVFIADAYGRKLLRFLNLTEGDHYDACQEIFEDGIRRDFDETELASVTKEYTQEELDYALCNAPDHEDISRVLLYQQFHAGIVELGISKRWNEFKEELQSVDGSSVNVSGPPERRGP